MNLPQLDITPDKFYKWGFFIFMGVAILNTINWVQMLFFFNTFGLINIASSAGSLAFNYLLAGFFYHLWSGTKVSISDEDFEKI